MMLNDEKSQLSKWLRELLGEENFRSATLYATNIVKCLFKSPPTKNPEGAYSFLQPYFEHCRSYLREEVQRFRPDLILSFGEAAHRHFISLFDPTHTIPSRMQGAFTGTFANASIGGAKFLYSPCLHITTFRVAETYGDSVKNFRRGIRTSFESFRQ
jgi:uracil-DNA glycosylase